MNRNSSAVRRRLLAVTSLALSIGLVSAPVEGEAIFAVTSSSGSQEFALSLLRFDSATPAAVESWIPLGGELAWSGGATLEFDLSTHALYGFGQEVCNILCPPIPVEPVRIDPFSGYASYVEWPNFPAYLVTGSDNDIDPATGDLRLHGFGNLNYRFNLGDLELVSDEPFETPAQSYFAGIALVPPGAGPRAGETYAIVAPNVNGGFQLLRIGGPQGSPPASSGEVTVIGNLAIQGTPAGFDISETGVAYFATGESIQVGPTFDFVNRLYRVDLANAAVEELGLIGGDSDLYVTGIAVAPLGLGPQILAVPSLSTAGLVLLALMLAGIVLLRFRALRRAP